MSFEVKLKKISHRSWTDISALWLPHISQLNFSIPGEKPAEQLSDFIGLNEIAASVKPEGDHRADLIGFRSLMMHEGIFFLHKAANVLVASHSQAKDGLPTWSTPTAYQSAFFSMEALFRLLGVAEVEVNNKTLVIDVWPSIEKSATRKAIAAYKLGSDIKFIQFNALQHYHRWALLQRLLRTLDNSPISTLAINAICALEEKEFARQRNQLHYSNTWSFEDLHTFVTPLKFCRFEKGINLAQDLDPTDPSFTVLLATVLFSSAVALLKSLSSRSRLIQDEYNLLNSACDPSRLKLRPNYEIGITNPIF